MIIDVIILVATTMIIAKYYCNYKLKRIYHYVIHSCLIVAQFLATKSILISLFSQE